MFTERQRARKADAISSVGMGTQPLHLTGRERAVYEVLDEHRGRVLSRHEIARRAGIVDLGERRCDALISGIRRGGVGQQIVTVRGRGWMLID